MTFDGYDQYTGFAVNGEFIYGTILKDARLAIDKYSMTSPQPKWINRSFSSIDLSRPQMVVLNNYIYVLGNRSDPYDSDDEVDGDIVEMARYDTRDDSWIRVSNKNGLFAGDYI